MKRTLLVAVLASVLALSGCGGGEEEEAKNAISGYLVKQNKSELVTLKQDEADCISEQMVDGIGVEKLQEYKLLTEDNTINETTDRPNMSPADSEIMVDAMFDCTDVMATMKKQLSSSMGQQSPEVQECMEEELNEKVVRALLVASFSGKQDEASQKLMGPFMECAMGSSGTPSN